MPYHTPRPTPHQYPTRRQAQRGLQVWVAPGAATSETAAQGRQSLLPSPRA
jgi:hypothetical protein